MPAVADGAGIFDLQSAFDSPEGDMREGEEREDPGLESGSAFARPPEDEGLGWSGASPVIGLQD